MSVPMRETAAERDSDAALLEQAAAVIRRRFGVLLAGDLIAGLTSLAVTIRADGGIIPAQEPPERVLTVEDTMDYNDPVHPQAYQLGGGY